MERIVEMMKYKRWALVGASAVAITVSTVALWAVLGPSVSGSNVLASLLGLAAIGLAGAAYFRSGRAVESAEKMSHDLDILSRRLLRVESRLAEVERLPHAELRKTVAEVSGEIALLSGLLRDLAANVSGHDQDLATIAQELYALRERAAQASRAGQAVLAAQPVPAAPAVPDPPAATAPPPAPIEPAPVLEPALPPANDARAAFGEAAQEDEQDESREAELFDAGSQPDPDSPREQRKRAILAAFREDRLEIHLQPVVSLPQRKTKFYEALARLRLDEETLLVPAEFMPALEEAGLAPELDGKIAARAAAVARHLVNRGSDAFVTSNLSPTAVRTPGFLRALGRIMEAYPDVLGRIAFEISQRCWRTLEAETAGALEQLRAKGAFFVLDRAIDLRIDALTLADRGVRYVKLPAQMLIDPQPSHGLDFAIGDLTTVLERAGIKLVADRVEAERIVPDLIELEAPLAQGFVFAAPRAVRPDIFNAGKRAAAKAQAGNGQTSKAQTSTTQTGTATANAPAPRQRAEPDATGPAQAEAAEPRLPYRSFLRRVG